MFHMTFLTILYFEWLLAPIKGKCSRKYLKLFYSETVWWVEDAYVLDISLYIDVVFVPVRQEF